ncbi:SMP-30/gluconolactonase/LRE family protein [Candidatus Poribacteria bacterium]|nr:SMP-30/gluconolactonase/LRE family protein [Candidatus Poribacteria bacterium]
MSTPSERKWDGAIVRYPDPAIEILDPRFKKYTIGNSVVERLWTGSRWAEGPAWFGDGGYLLWSDIPNNRILKWEESTGDVSTYRKPSNYSNGHTRDRQGRLVSCEHGARRVTRTEYDGTITVLMDSFEGKPLNAPNDVAIHPDGDVWFTDPGYGIMLNYEGHVAEFGLPTCVYRLNPDTGEATVVTDALEKPNGICFSPDHEKLYLVDTGVTHSEDTPRHLFVYDVIDGERLGKQEVFCDTAPGIADGIRCDVDGNLWASAGWAGDGYDGVHVYASDGTRIGQIHLPEICANLCFGGVKRNRLFMMGSQSLYSVYVEAQGVPYF